MGPAAYEYFWDPKVRRCRLNTSGFDPGLKALGFQPLEIKVLSTFLVSTGANLLHPYTKVTIDTEQAKKNIATKAAAQGKNIGGKAAVAAPAAPAPAPVVVDKPIPESSPRVKTDISLKGVKVVDADAKTKIKVKAVQVEPIRLTLG